MLTFALTPHYASDYSILMALVDMVPVILFFAAGILLLKHAAKQLNKVFYSMLAAGTIFVFASGFLKTIWKILAAANITDFVAFNLEFFPMQAIGFSLFGIAMLGLLKKKGDITPVCCVAPLGLIFLANPGEAPLEMTNMSLPFIIVQTIGCAMGQIVLMVVSFKQKKTLSGIMFIVSFVTMWGMAGLAAMDGKMDVTLWNWLEEIVNIASQGALLLGVLFLYKKRKDVAQA